MNVYASFNAFMFFIQQIFKSLQVISTVFNRTFEKKFKIHKKISLKKTVTSC